MNAIKHSLYNLVVISPGSLPQFCPRARDFTSNTIPRFRLHLPDPQAYLRIALREIGWKTEEVTDFGDSPDKISSLLELEGPQAQGMMRNYCLAP